MAAARLQGKQRRIAYLLWGGQFHGHLVRIVATLVLLQLVAPGVVLEGCPIITGVLTGLAERKSNIDAIHEREVVVCRQVCHGCHVCRAETIGLQVGEGMPGLGVLGAARQGSVIGSHGLVELSAGLQGMAAGGQGGGISGQFPQYLVEGGQGRFIVSGLHAFDGVE